MNKALPTKTEIHELKDFLILWSTQGISQLGSSITAFALTLWLYEKTGSALSTATLAICSYAPYVVMSIFAGALSDRFDKKKTMLVCDLLAAVCTVVVLALYKTNQLAIWHLYLINAISGLMNTVQQPASDVALTLLVPKERYQRAAGLNYLSRSAISILNPLIATALYGLAGLDLVIGVDLATFAIAFLTLAAFIKIPDTHKETEVSILKLAKEGLVYLKETPLVFTMILFMSGVNLVASAFDATLPAYVIPNPKGGTGMLGIVTACAGIAMVLGSLVASGLPKPKDRIRMIYTTMLFSLTVENFLLAFAREPVLWCVGQFLGWFVVPIMSANYEVVFRNTVPVDMQGRIYACRNTFQFFTIPIGLLFGGWMVDKVCEPFMAANVDSAVLTALFGSGKGSGAALMMCILGVLGALVCLIGGIKLNKYHYDEN